MSPCRRLQIIDVLRSLSHRNTPDRDTRDYRLLETTCCSNAWVEAGLEEHRAGEETVDSSETPCVNHSLIKRVDLR